MCIYVCVFMCMYIYIYTHTYIPSSDHFSEEYKQYVTKGGKKGMP